MSISKIIICISIILCIVSSSYGQYQKGDIIFQDDFQSGVLSSKWKIGKSPLYEILEKKLVGSQTQGHGATIRVPVEFKNAIIEFDVKFNGAKSFNVVVDDMNALKITHAGHVSRVSYYNGKSLTISDDVTGGMNLEVKKLDPEKRKSILEKTKASGKYSDENDKKWHHMKVVIYENLMEAYVDDKLIKSLKSEGIGHQTKTQWGFTTLGQSIEFDNIKMFSIL
jgi:hypothetical protein